MQQDTKVTMDCLQRLFMDLAYVNNAFSRGRGSDCPEKCFNHLANGDKSKRSCLLSPRRNEFGNAIKREKKYRPKVSWTQNIPRTNEGAGKAFGKKIVFSFAPHFLKIVHDACGRHGKDRKSVV